MFPDGKISKSLQGGQCMKKYSILGVIIRHPLKTLIRTAVTFLVLGLALTILGFNLTDNDFNIILIVSVILSAFSLKRRYNKESENEMLGIPNVKKPKRKSLLFGMLKSMNSSVDRQVEGFGNAVGSAFMGSSSSRAADEARYQAQQQQANAAARARWDALDRQKKAEWDARNAALRGKDKAAYQYQNQADYWRGQGKR